MDEGKIEAQVKGILGSATKAAEVHEAQTVIEILAHIGLEPMLDFGERMAKHHGVDHASYWGMVNTAVMSMICARAFERKPKDMTKEALLVEMVEVFKGNVDTLADAIRKEMEGG